MKKTAFTAAFCLLTIFVYNPVFSQEMPDEQQQETQTENDFTAAEDAAEDQAVFVINSIDFNIHGITRPRALISHADLEIGEEITGLSNLNNFIREKQQLLYNQRVLESVSIEHTIGEARADGKFPVDLLIHTRDTWNIIALPRPQYDSNTGFELTINARDYNFLGLMNALRLDVGFRRDTDGNNFYTLMLDTNIPLKMFGLDWRLSFANNYEYRPDLDFPHFFRNVTGLSVQFPMNRTTITVGANASFVVNEENPERYRDEFGRIQEGLFITTSPFAAWRIPTGLSYFDLGEIYYTPRLSATFVHQLPQWDLADFRRGPFITFSHSFGFGRIDWKDNFRRGASASLSHSVNYNFHRLRNDEQPWGMSLSAQAAGHTNINSFVGVSSRIRYRHWLFDDYHDNAGDVLRGILDNRIHANNMLSFNLDLNFRALRFHPTEWNIPISDRILRIFEFDLHLVPFIDAALYSFNPPSGDTRRQKVFGLENLLITAGFEVIIFPMRWRSLYLRLSVGRDFSIGGNSPTEIFIGTEFHF